MIDMTGENKNIRNILLAGHVFTLADSLTFFAKVFETINSLNN